MTVDFGTNVYQACQPAIRPDFINWYVNDRLVGGCLLQSASITSKISDPRYKIYMSQEDEEGRIPVCYLVVQRLEEKDSGVWTCKSSHPDSNIYEVSAKVLVHGEYNITVNADIALDWRSHLRLLTCHADIVRKSNLLRCFQLSHCTECNTQLAICSLELSENLANVIHFNCNDESHYC
ncbi:unnamed protein product [Taenia asiatica]|uniref:Ig-like domain-containing protein n=1 Tax=Taenia asiatica TaxID=60517 RepID=A0A3P6R447_TAEAS|nr:unnamed protein product [Taenia asiatica]